MSFKDQDFDWYEWPLALPRELWLSNEPDPKDQDATDLYEYEWNKIFEEKGKEGFLALFRDLAPYLVTPLLVVLVNGEPGRSTTIAWNIQPGGKEIETVEISI